MDFEFGSLFTGIGGIDLGLENAGMKCSWQVEIDHHCREKLNDHWPEVERFEDVKKVGKNNLKPTQLICGGFPCQDISIAGRRQGLVGKRSGLWFEFARIIDELRTGWVVIENVPGLLSSNGGRDLQTIVDHLVEFGYGVVWRVLDAQYFGVAQRRRRLFIIASFGSGSAAEVLFEREGVRWDYPTREGKGEGIAGTIDGKSCGSNRGGQANELDFIAYENHPADSRITETGDITQQLTHRMGTGGGNVPLVSRPLFFGKTIDHYDESMQTYIMSTGQANAEIIKDQSPTLSLNHEQPIIAYKIRGGKEGGGKGFLGSEDIAFALHEKEDQRIGVRRLTPLECERLQGFPDGWTAGQSDAVRYRQLGNAVAVPVAEWIGRRIMQVEEGKK